MDPPDERLARLLTDSRVRSILTELEHEKRLSVDDLAGNLRSRDANPFGATDSEGDLERTRVTLHHDLLPRLDEAGLVEYDTTDNVVRSTRSSEVDADWGEFEEITRLLSHYRTGNGADEDAIGILTGREAVYDYGRELADEAEGELFLMYSSDELLDEDCLPHAEEAIERGVDFHAGARSRDTRQFFKECLPEVTVWEPQVDWMNTRNGFPQISRLILADREKVVVGLWDETDGDGRREIAMIGEGTRNPLVVLVRELLGPRLDHLDFQSEDFLERLPFET